MFIGTGTKLTWDSGSQCAGFFAEILDIKLPNLQRGSVETSTMCTEDDHTYIPTKLVNNGELRLSLGFDEDQTPPIYEDAKEVEVTFPSGTTWTFDAFMTGYDPTVPLEDKCTADAVFKVTGGITIVPAASAS